MPGRMTSDCGGELDRQEADWRIVTAGCRHFGEKRCIRKHEAEEEGSILLLYYHIDILALRLSGR